MNAARTDLFSPLRPYQAEAWSAILDSVYRRAGLSFSVEIARQGGKNELSARLELDVLGRNIDRDVTNVKAAPTLRPQAMISLRRLWSLIERGGLRQWAAKEEGHIVRLGLARQVFLSADPTSNIVGHTAHLLLEVDEAQDVDPEKYDKELRPMTASTRATTVFYGTAWDDRNLLEQARQEHLEAERRDGVRRHFEYDWQVVAAANPAYERFVLAERERLGADHPLFLTQYCLKPIKGAGRLFGDNHLSLLAGSHLRLDAPLPGETYVAGLDIGGEGAAAEHDATVLTIARLLPTAAASPELEVVRHYAWTGEPHGDVQGALTSLLGATWRVRRVVVDATGIGEPVASALKRALRGVDVVPLKISADSKSRLGYGLLAAVNRGRLRLYAPAHDIEGAECWRQLRACRVAYRANGGLNFYVGRGDGHDDYVISLALAVAAADGSEPRRARGRTAEREPTPGGLQW